MAPVAEREHVAFRERQDRTSAPRPMACNSWASLNRTGFQVKSPETPCTRVGIGYGEMALVRKRCEIAGRPLYEGGASLHGAGLRWVPTCRARFLRHRMRPGGE